MYYSAFSKPKKLIWLSNMVISAAKRTLIKTIFLSFMNVAFSYVAMFLRGIQSKLEYIFWLNFIMIKNFEIYSKVTHAHLCLCVCGCTHALHM